MTHCANTRAQRLVGTQFDLPPQEAPSVRRSAGDAVRLPNGSGRRVLDAQSVKTTESGGERGGERGDDGAKKVNGRKRQCGGGTNSFLAPALVHAADRSDTAGAEWRCVEHFGRLNASPAETLLNERHHRFPQMAEIRIDKGDKAGLERRLAQHPSISFTVIEKPPEQKGFAVIPKRWAVR